MCPPTVNTSSVTMTDISPSPQQNMNIRHVHFQDDIVNFLAESWQKLDIKWHNTLLLPNAFMHIFQVFLSLWHFNDIHFTKGTCRVRGRSTVAPTSQGSVPLLEVILFGVFPPTSLLFSFSSSLWMIYSARFDGDMPLQMSQRRYECLWKTNLGK